MGTKPNNKTSAKTQPTAAKSPFEAVFKQGVELFKKSHFESAGERFALLFERTGDLYFAALAELCANARQYGFHPYIVAIFERAVEWASFGADGGEGERGDNAHGERGGARGDSRKSRINSREAKRNEAIDETLKSLEYRTRYWADGAAATSALPRQSDFAAQQAGFLAAQFSQSAGFKAAQKAQNGDFSAAQNHATKSGDFKPAQTPQTPQTPSISQLTPADNEKTAQTAQSGGFHPAQSAQNLPQNLPPKTPQILVDRLFSWLNAIAQYACDAERAGRARDMVAYDEFADIAAGADFGQAYGDLVVGGSRLVFKTPREFAAFADKLAQNGFAEGVVRYLEGGGLGNDPFIFYGDIGERLRQVLGADGAENPAQKTPNSNLNESPANFGDTGANLVKSKSVKRSPKPRAKSSAKKSPNPATTTPQNPAQNPARIKPAAAQPPAQNDDKNPAKKDKKNENNP